jgi:hypothetical protein
MPAARAGRHVLPGGGNDVAHPGAPGRGPIRPALAARAAPGDNDRRRPGLRTA